MLSKLLTLPLLFFPWKTLLIGLLIISSMGLYSYVALADNLEWLPSLSAPVTDKPIINSAYFWALLRSVFIWLIATLALPFLLIPLDKVVFSQQKNQANALLLVFTVSLSTLLAAYLFYALLPELALSIGLGLFTGLSVYYHYHCLDWLEQQLS